MSRLLVLTRAIARAKARVRVGLAKHEDLSEVLAFDVVTLLDETSVLRHFYG